MKKMEFKIIFILLIACQVAKSLEDEWNFAETSTDYVEVSSNVTEESSSLTEKVNVSVNKLGRFINYVRSLIMNFNADNKDVDSEIVMDKNGKIMREKNGEVLMDLTVRSGIVSDEYKLIPRYQIPSFAKKSLAQRNKRAVGLIFGVIARYLLLGSVMAGAAVGASVVDRAISENSIITDHSRVARPSIDCAKSNFGCANNICWSNCGPRLMSGDWCLTTHKNATLTYTGPSIALQYNLTNIPQPMNHMNPHLVNSSRHLLKKRKITYAECETTADCNPCWKCAGTCIIDGYDFSRILANDKFNAENGK